MPIIRANFRQFGDFNSQNCDVIDLTPKGMRFPRDTRFEILFVKIGSRVCFVGLFKKSITLKSKRGGN